MKYYLVILQQQNYVNDEIFHENVEIPFLTHLVIFLIFNINIQNKIENTKLKQIG